MAIEYFVGATPKLQVTCKDKSSGSTVDLSGYTATIAFSIDGGTVTTATMSKPGTTGVAEHTFTTAQLGEEGNVEIQVTLDSGSGTVYKSDFIRRRVIKSLA